MDFDFKTLLVIMVVVLIIFGGKKLRSVGDDLGHAVRGFKSAMNEGDREESAGSHKQIGSDGADADLTRTLKGSKNESKSRRTV